MSSADLFTPDERLLVTPDERLLVTPDERLLDPECDGRPTQLCKQLSRGETVAAALR